MVAIPPPVESILQWWFPCIQQVLDAKLKSVYLYGSITLDDYNPAWSDVDACVVLEKPVTDQEAKSIFLIHDEMKQEFLDESGSKADGWQSGQVVEAIYVSESLADNAAGKEMCALAFGGTRKRESSTLGSAYDRYMLHHHSLLWWGEKIVFAAPSWQSQVEQSREDLVTLKIWDPVNASPIWLAGMIHWIARAIVFYRDGTMMSKSAALRHEIAKASPFASAFELALKVRELGSATAAQFHSELKEEFTAIAGPAATAIEEYLAAGNQ
jgi:hypothetical protein